MTSAWIEFNGTRYPLDRNSLPSDRSSLSPNQVRAVDFITQWLNGRSDFSIETSGSTGVPKTIHLTRESLVASARKTIEALGLAPGTTALVCLNIDYIAGIMMLVRGLTGNMNLIVTEPNADPLEKLSATTRIDFAAIVPYQVAKLLDHGGLDRISVAIIGGAALDHRLEEKLSEVTAPCYATFGMTETVSHIALRALNGSQRRDHFTTLPGIEVTTDQRGCLVIQADYLTGTIVTNDVVELISSRDFRWLGRFDHVINSGGVKIHPEKVEAAIDEWMKSNDASRRYFVTSLPHDRLGEQIVLVLEGSTGTPTSLLEFLRSRLGKYEVPKQVLCAGHFEETRTGKINRKATLAIASPCPNP